MPEEQVQPSIGARVRRLAEFLTSTGAVRVRIARPESDIEVTRFARARPAADSIASLDSVEVPLGKVDTIVADLVGVFRLGRPAPLEGESLTGDRELGYVEALGIRNPVRSLGAGRIVDIPVSDGAPVEYGQPLFLLDRG